MKDLIDDVFVGLRQSVLAPLSDQARITLASLATWRPPCHDVGFIRVDPLVFPGSDISKLAVCGTVNAGGAAPPRSMSCAAIIERLPLDLLRRLASSMAETARKPVLVVCGTRKG